MERYAYIGVHEPRAPFVAMGCILLRRFSTPFRGGRDLGHYQENFSNARALVAAEIPRDTVLCLWVFLEKRHLWCRDTWRDTGWEFNKG